MKQSHCQLSNCSRGIIDSTSTGIVSTVQVTSRSRSPRMRSSCSSTIVGTSPSNLSNESRPLTSIGPFG